MRHVMRPAGAFLILMSSVVWGVPPDQPETAVANVAGTAAAAGGGGACCLPDLACVAATSQVDCWSRSGVYQGDGSDCAQTTCVPYPSSGVELLGWVGKRQFPDALNHTNNSNDCWGYVSPSGREYALYGMWSGTGFVEVTDPRNPVIVGYIDGPDSTWRDMKTFDEFAYVLSEAGFGMQIVDLRDIDNGNVALLKTENFNNFVFTAHNLYINEESGFAYAVLTDFVRGLVAIDLSDPVNPVVAGSWDGDAGQGNGIHDLQVVNMDVGGQPREIAFACNESRGFFIIDVTDKAGMFTRASIDYPNNRYAHQGWLSADRRFFFLGDELDERDDPDVSTTTTYVFNVENIDNPFLLTTFTTGLTTIDHNLFVRGRYLYEANYTSGLRIFDVADVNNAVEVGFFDSYPEQDTLSFSGAWGTYPFLPSGSILISDRQHGLFIVDASAVAPQPRPTIELRPVGGVGTSITVAPGDRFAVEAYVSGWSPALLQTVRVGIEPGALGSACAGTLTLFDSDADNDGVCDSGNAQFCPTCTSAIAAGQFDGVFSDDCRADHFSQVNPAVPPASVTVDIAGLSFEWAGQSTGAADSGQARYAGTFVFQMSPDAYGSFDLQITAAPQSAMVDDVGLPIAFAPVLNGATINSSVRNAYGDIDGNGVLNIFDLFCIIDGLNDVFVDCALVDVDIEPCTPNGVINVFDLFALIDSLGGEQPCCVRP